MINYSEIANLIVECSTCHRKKSNVKDIVIDGQNKKIRGIILDTLPEKCIYLKDIDRVKNGKIYVNSCKNIFILKKDKFMHDLYTKYKFDNFKINGKKVSDIYFDLLSGKIYNIKITDGLIQDLLAGKKNIPADYLNNNMSF